MSKKTRPYDAKRKRRRKSVMRVKAKARLLKRESIAAAIADAKEKGLYEVLEHQASSVNLDDR